MRRDLTVFLCHSSVDKDAVRELYRKLLDAHRISPWLDEENLLPGQDWDLEIKRAIGKSDIVLVCLSESSINKAGYIQKEVRCAIDIAQEKPEGTIFLIPVKLGACKVPSRLEALHWVDLHADRGFERLLSALRKRAEDLGIAEVRAIESSDFASHSALDRIANLLRISRADATAMSTELAKNDIPTWFRQATLALDRLAEETPDAVRRATEAKSYLVSIVRYTHIEDNLQTIQVELARYIEGLGLGIQRRFVAEEFRISITPPVAGSKVLYVFPYFHVRSRRRHWGVLPFAQQTKIGFVVHETHPALGEWERIAGTSGTDDVSISDAARWFDSLIFHTDSTNGTIYSVDGFIFYEILCEALTHSRSEASTTMSRLHMSVRPEEQNSLFFANTLATTSVFIFDPGEQKRVDALIQPGFRAIVAPHSVDVPVGIGFSLPCLPQLLKDGRWKSVLMEAMRLYKAHDEALEQLGIRLLL